jgi:zinc transport system substrate-binding protein
MNLTIVANKASLDVVPRISFAVLLLALLAVAGCGSDGSGSASSGERQTVAAAFYPLQWVTEEVAGHRAKVESLTPPGAEPHDLELGPRDLVAVGEADLVVYLRGFQPSVDQAVEQEAAEASLDVTDAARLTAAEPADHEGDEHAGTGDHDEHGATDPHFWLDPTRLADVADAVAARLADGDPQHAAGYRARAADVRADLEQLDREMATGLAECDSTDLVTSHRAFGYLAERYGLHQVGISGLSPEAEPSPQQLAAVAAYAEEHDVRTIYYETLVSPTVAETMARETGATTAVLDPLEGLTEDSTGTDYLAVMRGNLQTLQRGQGCS